MPDWKQHVHERTLSDLEARCDLLDTITSEDGRYALLAFCPKGTDKAAVRAVKDAKDPAEWQRAAEEALEVLNHAEQDEKAGKGDAGSVRREEHAGNPAERGL